MIRFLDPLMLVFGLAAAVPPIVAWLARRDAVPREWAAMEILARAAGRTAFRRRCIDWLVVAMRCATLLAVAFAAARPLFVPAEAGNDPAVNDAAARGPRAVVVGDATAVVAAIESAAPDLAPVRSIEESRLDDEPFESASLVVLADGVVPTAAAAGRLGRFVERGGGVAVLLGPRTVKREAVIDLPSRQTISLAATAEGAPEIDLAGPTVGRMARLVAGQAIPGVAARPQGPPVVLARAMTSGHPLAVRLGFGEGAIGIVAVPLAIEGWAGGGWAATAPAASAGGATAPAVPAGGAIWSDLPAWPAFLPFVERTILSLAAPRGLIAAGPGAGGFRSGGTASGGTASGIAEWLAGSNLSGLAIVVALLLVLLDPLMPLMTRLGNPRSRIR